MEWNSEYNNAIAMLLVAIIGPMAIRKHKEAHQEAKRRMKDGWLKYLVTHEFWKRRTGDS